jgi:hypothetical protein
MIMKFLDLWNKFMFTPTFNVFDVVVWAIVLTLATTYSYWWFLLYIPATVFSSLQQIMLEQNEVK